MADRAPIVLDAGTFRQLDKTAGDSLPVGFQFRDVVLHTTNPATLTIDDADILHIADDTAVEGFTLPLVNTLPVGTVFAFHNRSSFFYPTVFADSSVTDSISQDGSIVTSIVIEPGNSLILVSDGIEGWIPIEIYPLYANEDEIRLGSNSRLVKADALFLARYTVPDHDVLNRVEFHPVSGTSGAGGGIGTVWSPGGTVSHPTPSAGVVSQMYRTRYANVATTAHQTLGVIQTAAGLRSFWRGNADFCGGFYFRSKFIIELMPAASIRLFCGLTTLATPMVADDSPAGDFIGLWHQQTEAASVLNIIMRDNTTTLKDPITLNTNLAAGQAFELEMIAFPWSATIRVIVKDLTTHTIIWDFEYNDTTYPIPRDSVFMGAQCQMSNHTNGTVTTTAIGINEILVTSHNAA